MIESAREYGKGHELSPTTGVHYGVTQLGLVDLFQSGGHQDIEVVAGSVPQCDMKAEVVLDSNLYEASTSLGSTGG